MMTKAVLARLTSIRTRETRRTFRCSMKTMEDKTVVRMRRSQSCTFGEVSAMRASLKFKSESLKSNK